jgi:hypothetical protein
MQKAKITFDFTYPRNPLFVRQTVAVTFGLRPRGDLTWDDLTSHILSLEDSALPREIYVRGAINLSLALPEEDRSLGQLFAVLRNRNPEVKIMYQLH